MAKLFRYLFLGALALIPLVVVVQLIFWIKSLGLGFFQYLSSVTNSTIMSYSIIVSTVVILILIGLSIEKAGKSYVVNLIDSFLEQVPAIGTVYGIVKKLQNYLSQIQKTKKKRLF